MKKYQVRLEYRPSGQGTEYPIRRMEIDFRTGQYTTPKGGSLYGIVEGDVKIREKKIDDPFSWIEIEHKKVP